MRHGEDGLTSRATASRPAGDSENAEWSRVAARGARER